MTKKITREFLKELDKKETFEFSPNGENLWAEEVKKYKNDIYGQILLYFARVWAKYMQKLIDDGAEISDIAETSAKECSIIDEDFRDFMFPHAFRLLEKTWRYGYKLTSYMESVTIFS